MDEPPIRKSVEAEIEALNAKVEALNEVKRGFNERIAALSEKMGELRYMLVSYGKDIEETKAAAQKAMGLVEDIQPNAILTALRKNDAKAEILQSKVESNEVLMNRVISEIKDMRRAVGQFEGVHKLEEVTDELKGSLKEAAKLEAGMRRESQMVKDIFVEVQEKLKEFRIFDERISGMGEEFKSVLKEFDHLKAGFMGVAKVEDLEKLKAGIDFRMKRAETLLESVSAERKQLSDFVQSEKVVKFAERLDTWLKAGVGLEAGLRELQKRVDALDRLDRKLEEREDRLEKTVSEALVKIKKEKETGDLRRGLEEAAKSLQETRASQKRVVQLERDLAATGKGLKAVEKEMAALKKDIGAGIKRIILKQLQEM